MQQEAEGELPCERLPKQAKDVQLFEHIAQPLLSGGKLATNDCSIVCNIPNAHVLTGETRDKVRTIITKAKESHCEEILLTVPFDPVMLTWRTMDNPQAMNSTPPSDISYNVHRIRSKEVLVDYFHRAAGYPMKKTWLQATKENFFITSPGLTYQLVAKFLPEDTEETAAGHLHRRRQGIQSTKVPEDDLEP